VNDSYCQEHFGGSPCEEWECTPIGDEVKDHVSGCRIKTNHTHDCEVELGVEPGQPKSACMTVQCTGATTMTTKCEDMLVDTCTGSNACHTIQCTEQSDSSYQCTDVMVIPQDDFCTTWKCDDVEGWIHDEVLDDTSCEAAYEEYSKTHTDFDMRCKIFSCDPNNDGTVKRGCKYEEQPDCSYECTIEDFRGCLQNTTQQDNEACAYGYCDAHLSDDSTTWITECKMSEPVNCIAADSEAALQAKALNEANERVCYTPVCGVNGKCTIDKLTIPDSMVATNCSEPRCVPIDGTGSWKWAMVDTKVKTMCVTDDCYSRECVDDTGCVAIEKCRVNTTECDTYECVLEAGVPKCKHTDLRNTFLDLECMFEQCVDGKRVPIYKELDVACTDHTKCEKASCVNGSCVYTPTTHSGNDLCLNYECDPETGIWSTSPKCNDGLACTVDTCWNYGTFYECHNVSVQCNLTMDEFTCFYQACRETGNSSEYKCVRKLLPNRYIDMCGNCLLDNPDEAGSDASNVDAFYKCTNAPDEPMMVETLAAATIALIIIGAVIAGAAVTTSSVLGTKALVKRARQANNQSAHNNPLFEGAENEMTNPAFARESSKTHM